MSYRWSCARNSITANATSTIEMRISNSTSSLGRPYHFSISVWVRTPTVWVIDKTADTTMTHKNQSCVCIDDVFIYLNTSIIARIETACVFLVGLHFPLQGTMRFKHLTYKQKMVKDRKRNPERKKTHSRTDGKSCIDRLEAKNQSINFLSFFPLCFYLFDENPLFSFINLLFLCIFSIFVVVVVQEAVSFFTLNSISYNNN